MQQHLGARAPGCRAAASVGRACGHANGAGRRCLSHPDARPWVPTMAADSPGRRRKTHDDLLLKSDTRASRCRFVQRCQQPDRAGRHRVHRIRHLATRRPRARCWRWMASPVARHRSREVLLYRQGGINVVVNAHRPTPCGGRPAGAMTPAIGWPSGALRVRDAAPPTDYAIERGAWAGAAARRGDGAQHPRHPRRRRQPHLLRRPLPRLLDLRRGTSCPSPAWTTVRRLVAGVHSSASSQYIGAERIRLDEFYRELFNSR